MTPAEAILFALWVPVAGASGYLSFLTLLSRRPPAPAPPAPRLRFAIVVPAHDEAAGIASTVESLAAVDYPRALRRILVVADNCTDDTAARARAAGAEVMVRDEPALRGKGYALRHAFDRVVSEGWADAVAVVDADTVISPNLLHAFAARVDAGGSAIQADYAVRNPFASWRTALSAIALGAVHGLRSLARERLLLSSGLRGNGMCFTTRLLRAVPHDAVSIVEDLEYGLRLGEAGYRVHHAHEAHVYGEMPAGAHAAATQRRRWEGGRRYMVRMHAGRLLARALRERDRIALDLAIDLLIPPLGTLVTLTLIGLAASLALSWWSGHLTWITWAFLACGLGLSGYVLRGWQLSGTGVRGLAAFRRVPGFLVWKLFVGARAASGGGSEWVRTPR